MNEEKKKCQNKKFVALFFCSKKNELTRKSNTIKVCVTGTYTVFFFKWKFVFWLSFNWNKKVYCIKFDIVLHFFIKNSFQLSTQRRRHSNKLKWVEFLRKKKHNFLAMIEYRFSISIESPNCDKIPKNMQSIFWIIFVNHWSKKIWMLKSSIDQPKRALENEVKCSPKIK